MLHEQIRRLRMAHGITQVELAHRLGVSKQSVSNWENDNIQPSIDMLMKICNTFSVNADYLLGIDPAETIDISSLTDEEKKIVFSLMTYFQNNKHSQQ